MLPTVGSHRFYILRLLHIFLIRLVVLRECAREALYYSGFNSLVDGGLSMNSNAAFGQAEADRVLEYAKLYVAEAGDSWAQG